MAILICLNGIQRVAVLPGEKSFSSTKQGLSNGFLVNKQKRGHGLWPR